MANPWKTSWNVLAAFALFATSVGVAWSDFKYQGDFIFRIFQNPTVWLGWLTVFIFLWFLLSHLFAVFPKRFLFPVGLLFLSRMSLGFPLNLIFENKTACLIMSISLALVTGFYFLGSVFHFLGLSSRRWFGWKHSFSVLSVSLALLVLSIPLGIGGVVMGMRNTFGDYTRISLTSISMVERGFRKNGKKVFLIGMMHIGEEDFYQAINSRLEASSGSGRKVVLTEGVSDRKEILPKSFREGKTYEKWAKALGLEVQDSDRRGISTMEQADRKRRWAQRGVEFINADIDVSELSPDHQKRLIKSLEDVGSGGLAEIIANQNIPSDELEDLVMEGLIQFRNDRLMEKFNEVIDRDISEVLIPWGAAHLPDIEDRLEKDGFERFHEEIRPVVRFWKGRKRGIRE